MKIFLLLFISFLLVGCMKTPEVPASKEVVATKKIQNNKTESEIAKEEYLKLQRSRDKE